MSQCWLHVLPKWQSYLPLHYTITEIATQLWGCHSTTVATQVAQTPPCNKNASRRKSYSKHFLISAYGTVVLSQQWHLATCVMSGQSPAWLRASREEQSSYYQLFLWPQISMRKIEPVSPQSVCFLLASAIWMQTSTEECSSSFLAHLHLPSCGNSGLWKFRQLPTFGNRVGEGGRDCSRLGYHLGNKN